jgi:hypothetical protein
MSATMLRIGRPRDRGQIPGRSKRFFFLQHCPHLSVTPAYMTFLKFFYNYVSCKFNFALVYFRA